MAWMLELLMGSADGRVLKFKADVPFDGTERAAHAQTRVAVADGWTRAIVYTVEKPQRQRAFLLVPNDAEEEIVFGAFYVRGRFRIEERINNPRRAREAWEAFGE